METVRLTEGGWVLIPKAILEARGWENGVEFVVEETAEGLLVKPLKLFSNQDIEDVFGCLRYPGPAKSLEEMDWAITEEAETRR